MAGYVDHRSYFIKKNNIIESHLLGTLNSVLYANKLNLKKYLYIGSSDEYGLNKAPQNETQREMPSSTYSFAKTSSVHFLQMISRSENFPSSSIRIFLTYGPNQKENRFIFSATNFSQIAEPIPPDAPVTIIFLFFKSLIYLNLLYHSLN